MPNNEDFNNELPKMNNNENNQNAMQMPNQVQNNTVNKPLIEIPQEYYDKLAEEERIKKEEEEKKRIEYENKKQISQENNKIFSMSVLNIFIIFACLYATINIIEYALFAIPAYIVLLAIINAITKKKESNFPISMVISGIIIAVITFVISMINEEQMDTWNYYCIGSLISGFVGYMVSALITSIIADKENVKALQTIGIFIFFALLIAIPGYLYKKYPEEFYRIVFQKSNVVQAENEEEFLVKTLKSRYNQNFSCEEKGDTLFFSEKVIDKRVICKDENNIEFATETVEYNKQLNQYIVFDDYLDTIHLDPIKKELKDKIILSTGASEKNVNVYFYPEEVCHFTGDCAECDEYFQRYTQESDLDYLYKKSSKIDNVKYLKMDSYDFFNNYKFKVIITVKGGYDEKTTDFKIITQSILNILNESKIKNTYGFNVEIDSIISTEGIYQTSYKAIGQASSDGLFKDDYKEINNK